MPEKFMHTDTPKREWDWVLSTLQGFCKIAGGLLAYGLVHLLVRGGLAVPWVYGVVGGMVALTAVHMLRVWRGMRLKAAFYVYPRLLLSRKSLGATWKYAGAGEFVVDFLAEVYCRRNEGMSYGFHVWNAFVIVFWVMYGVGLLWGDVAGGTVEPRLFVLAVVLVILFDLMLERKPKPNSSEESAAAAV